MAPCIEAGPIFNTFFDIFNLCNIVINNDIKQLYIEMVPVLTIFLLSKIYMCTDCLFLEVRVVINLPPITKNINPLVFLEQRIYI